MTNQHRVRTSAAAASRHGADLEVNRAIPFYNRMEELHANAREIPRLEEWPLVARIIDRMVLAAINTTETVESIAHGAQSEVQKLLPNQR